MCFISIPNCLWDDLVVISFGRWTRLQPQRSQEITSSFQVSLYCLSRTSLIIHDRQFRVMEDTIRRGREDVCITHRFWHHRADCEPSDFLCTYGDPVQSQRITKQVSIVLPDSISHVNLSLQGPARKTRRAITQGLFPHDHR